VQERWSAGMDSRTATLRTLFTGKLMYTPGLPFPGRRSTEHNMSETCCLCSSYVAQWNAEEGLKGDGEQHFDDE